MKGDMYVLEKTFVNSSHNVECERLTEPSGSRYDIMMQKLELEKNTPEEEFAVCSECNQPHLEYRVVKLQ